MGVLAPKEGHWDR